MKFFLNQICRKVLVSVGVLVMAQSGMATVVSGITGPVVREFLGGVGGKVVYTKWEGTCNTTSCYNNGRSLWYVDFSENVLTERRIIQLSNDQPENAVISYDGNWIAYSLTNAKRVYICPLQENATPISICDGGQPKWWYQRLTGKLFIICNDGGMMVTWQDTWQKSNGHTYIQEINSVTKQPVGSRSSLINYYANGGRSYYGGWLFSAGQATGSYQINPTATSNVSIISSNHFTTESGCNPSISPDTTDDSILVMHNGGAYPDETLGLYAHTYFLIRKPDGTIVRVCKKNPADGNVYMDTPRWSSHKNYAAYVASPANTAPPYDLYLYRISDSTSLRILDGNYFWCNLWVNRDLVSVKPAVFQKNGPSQYIHHPTRIMITGAQDKVTMGKDVSVFDIYGRKINMLGNNSTGVLTKSPHILVVVPKKIKNQ